MFHPGQLVMVDIPGKRLDAETAAFLREHQIRAVCLFRKNLGSEDEIRRLTADLRAVMGEQALIGIDQEGGSVIRATSLPQAPAAMALGAVGDEALAEEVGAAVARGLRHLGINWNFAPVLDVNNNPANPVIGERSFGEDPALVTRMARAWMRGSLREGVACCVKHFPGHGDTHVDSHHALPTVDKTEAELEALELIPFRALSPEAPAMMTAHIVYPQIDPEHPATLSHKILSGILRQRMGYRGVVITDALMMKAVHERYGHARAAVLALQAGADMPLAQGSQAEQAAAIEAIAAALADGRLTTAQLQAAQQRLDALAEAYPLAPRDYPTMQREADDALMHRGWERGLTAVGAAQAPDRSRPLRVLTQASVASDGVSEAGLPAEEVAALFAAFDDVEFVHLVDLRRLQAGDLPRDERLNVLVSNHRGRFEAAARGAKVDLHLALWNPFQVMDIAAPAVVSWGYGEGALAALRGWLEGRLAATANAPVTLN
ncbi:beta-N-acetylhexosaminidase [Roseateles violae]|uniref:Beta-N-acetylhexosaminidase n=1 Tax=Roseateles violae TaxID=3058042 RepID=A0ABT8DP27_9BURK|nr:beta-N-acetylhexosaminidase [Pelomonas sp. PFR6]MDN3919728.1 beta-N-acetylhexosaminidase [Pelomonas sp. PFR6]